MDIQYFKTKNDTFIGKDYFNDNLSFTLPYTISLVIMSLAGTLGNILVVLTIATNKRLRTIGNLFILNLALADLCITIFVDAFSIVGVTQGEVFFMDKPVLCEFIGSLCLTSCYCSLLSIAGISFNRAIHICYNSLYRTIFTFKKTIAILIGTWIVSFLLEMPNLIGWGGHSYDRKMLYCIFDRTASFTYSLFFSTVIIGVPWLLICACYVKIYLYVRRSKLRLDGMREVRPSDISNRESSDSMKLARTLFVIFTAFTICWAPFAILIVVDFDDRLPNYVHALSISLAHANSSFNSVLYGITNKNFKKSYLYMLRKITPCMKSEEHRNETALSEVGKCGGNVYRRLDERTLNTV